MIRDYQDIISRLGKPEWWDSNGAPRYQKFNPDLCGVYDSYVAFMEIACQSCDARFMVSSEIDMAEAKNPNFYLPTKPLSGDEKKIEQVTNQLDKECDQESPWVQVGSFHWGDPPPTFHKMDCLSGPTMNSIPIRIIEFWKKSDNIVEGWIRDTNYEFEFSKLHSEG